MRETSPELFLPEAEKAAIAKEAVADAAAEEARREDLNRFADDAAEGMAMHITNDVDLSTRTRMLLELTRDGQPSQQTLERFAEQMHMSVGDTVDALNAVHANTSAQLNAYCNAHGVDANAFATYMKTYRPTEFFRCVQIHADRDLERAWSMEVAQFKARGQR